MDNPLEHLFAPALTSEEDDERHRPGSQARMLPASPASATRFYRLRRASFPATPGAEFDPFLSARWREHRRHASAAAAAAGARANTSNYPRHVAAGRHAPGLMGPPNGSFPGSDLDFMRAQLLGIRLTPHYGLLCPWSAAAPVSATSTMARPCATAVQRMATRHAGPIREQRLKGPVQIPLEHTKAAIAEIETRARRPPLRAGQIPPRSLEPLGRRRYRPILDVLRRHGFPIALHSRRHQRRTPPPAAVAPRFHHEEHPVLRADRMQALVTSLVCEGTLEGIPNLRAVLVEGGSAWMPRSPGASTSTGNACGGGPASETCAPPNMSANASGSPPSRSRNPNGRTTCWPT